MGSLLTCPSHRVPEPESLQCRRRPDGGSGHAGSCHTLPPRALAGCRTARRPFPSVNRSSKGAVSRPMLARRAVGETRLRVVTNARHASATPGRGSGHAGSRHTLPPRALAGCGTARRPFLSVNQSANGAVSRLMLARRAVGELQLRVVTNARHTSATPGRGSASSGSRHRLAPRALAGCGTAPRPLPSVNRATKGAVSRLMLATRAVGELRFQVGTNAPHTSAMPGNLPRDARPDEMRDRTPRATIATAAIEAARHDPEASGILLRVRPL